MTFLPIIARELRVAARKRSTFWMRVIAALVAVVIGCGFLILFRVGAVQALNLGDTLFRVLSWLALIGALSAGLFFTSDCLSEENREGTLGFLFLTDLRGYDVAGGKLAASSLRVSFALLAIFPVLAVTLLIGAVAGAQVFKVSIALMNALFCSLAAGLAVSSASRDAQRALAGTLFLLLFLVFGGPLADQAVTAAVHRSYRPVLSLTSPAYVFTAAGAWGRNPFWLGLSLTQAIAWALVALASVLAPRTWQERPARTGGSKRARWWKYGGARRQAGLRRRLLAGHPVRWLASRERWQALGAWGIALAQLALFAGLLAGGAPPLVWIGWSSVNALIALLLYLWIASQACRFFVETRRSGFLEGILSTSLSVPEIVHDQWRTLLRMFGPPAMLWMLLQLAAVVPVNRAATGFTAMTTSTVTSTNGVTITTQVTAGTNAGAVSASATPGIPSAVLLVTTATGTIISLAGLVTLVWFGMWMGLTSKNTGLAMLKTLLFVKIIPSFAISFVATLVAAVFMIPRISKLVATARSSAGPSAMTNSMMWFPLVIGAVSMVLYLALDIGLIVWARRKLLSSFREQAQRGPVEYAPIAPPRAPGPVPPVIGAPPPAAPGPLALPAG